jgi:hypothetical protein
MTKHERSELRVNVSRDHDDDCSVAVTVTSGSFAGRGHAWLHSTDISEFVSVTKRLASTSTGEAALRGGYINPDGSPDYTVNLSFLPHGLRGHILLMAELSSGLPTSNAKAQIVSRVAAALIIEPAALDRFADELSCIPKGGSVEAAVPGESAA